MLDPPLGLHRRQIYGILPPNGLVMFRVLEIVRFSRRMSTVQYDWKFPKLEPSYDLTYWQVWVFFTPSGSLRHKIQLETLVLPEVRISVQQSSGLVKNDPSHSLSANKPAQFFLTVVHSFSKSFWKTSFFPKGVSVCIRVEVSLARRAAPISRRVFQGCARKNPKLPSLILDSLISYTRDLEQRRESENSWFLNFMLQGKINKKIAVAQQQTVIFTPAKVWENLWYDE